MVSVLTRTAFDMALATQYITECLCSSRRLCIATDVLMLVTSSGVLVCSVLGANGVISLSKPSGYVNGTTTHTTIEHAFDETTICITVAVLEIINIVFGTTLLIIISKAEPSARALWAWLLAWGSAQAQALTLGLALAAHALRGPGGARLLGGLLVGHVAYRFVLAALLIAATNTLRTRVSEPQQLLNRQVTFSHPTAPSAGEEPDPQRPSEKSRLQRFDSRKSAFTMWNDDTGCAVKIFQDFTWIFRLRLKMSQHLHKHYFAPVCILTHCWCCGLRSAVVAAACATSFLGACGFVFSVYGLVFGVYATTTYTQEYYMEKQFNDSMYEAYKRFNRSAHQICIARAHLTSTESAEARRRHRPQQNFNLDRMRPDLYKIFNEDEIAQLAINRLNYGTESGRAQARSFWQAYRKWRTRRLLRAGAGNRKDTDPSHSFSFDYEPDKDSRAIESTKKENLCDSPYITARIRVDNKINVLRVALFGKYLLKTHQGVLAVCWMDLITSITILVVCIVLIWGVMENKPTLIVPWLVVTPYFVIFNLVFVDTYVCMYLIAKQDREFVPYVNPIVFLLSGLVLVFFTLAVFTVASYLYLIYIADHYLHQYPHSTQVVASGTTDTIPENELDDIMRTMKALQKSKREQKESGAR